MAMNELSPCRACESDNVAMTKRNYPVPWFNVQCGDCGLDGEFERTPAEAAESWNGDDEE